jgi:hypothetical protein
MGKAVPLFAAIAVFLMAVWADCSVASASVRPQSVSSLLSLNGGTVCMRTPASPTTTKPHAWFVQARQEWRLGAESDAASEGLCWWKAALDLDSVASVIRAGTSGYLGAADELEKLAALPDAMDTAAQINESHTLIRRLNGFFGTKDEYGVGAPSPTTTAPDEQLTISVESSSQMQANGNSGPPSSILIPTSCDLSGTTVTAKGAYQGGFAPNLYNRYGDIVELYVFGAPSSGYPQGPQLAASSATDSPPIGGSGSWQVSTNVDLGVGSPEKCVVAAQPTHDLQLAP